MASSFKAIAFLNLLLLKREIVCFLCIQSKKIPNLLQLCTHTSTSRYATDQWIHGLAGTVAQHRSRSSCSAPYHRNCNRKREMAEDHHLFALLRALADDFPVKKERRPATALICRSARPDWLLARPRLGRAADRKQARFAR
jgi:hypothetical protein